MKARTEKLYLWATEKANSKNSPLWIALLFSLEIFLLIPLDAVLFFFGLQNRKKIFHYAIIGAIASTFSGCLGYFLGHFLWDSIGPYVVPGLISSSSFEHFSLHFEQYEHWAVFFGSLLPFPLKALSLIAGVFHLPFFPYFCCLLAARLLRFTLVACAVAFWGEKVKGFIDRHFHQIMLLVFAKIALAIVFFWILAKI